MDEAGGLLLEVKNDIAEIFLDVTVNLPLSCGGEGLVAPLTSQVPPELVGKVTATDVEPEDRFGDHISLSPTSHQDEDSS